MRKGEIISLKWFNVDLENNLITLEHTNTKNKKTRKISINSKLRKLLLEQRLKSAGREYVFLNSDGRPYMRHDSLNRAYEGACRRANIKGLRFHDLRHTAATRMLEKGAKIEAVSKMLGHSSLNITMRYSHPDDSLKEAAEKLADFVSTTDQSTDQQKSQK